MKITAEFNSVDEVLAFASTFANKNLGGTTLPIVVNTPKVSEAVKEEVKTKEPVQIHTPDKEEPQKETVVEEQAQAQEENKEEISVTKEMVREKLGAAMKAGKQAEVKALVKKYGATKVPDLKEEHYKAVYEEAGALL